MRRISLTLLLALVFPALAAGAARDTNLSLVAYSTPREAYAQLIPAFQKTAAGKGVTFSQSYAASGEQSRAVAAGLDADVVAFSLAPDITSLVQKKLVPQSWNNDKWHGMVTRSVVVFVLRAGKTPKQAQAYLAHMWKHVVAQPASAREGLATFLAGRGDVFLAYENEALFAQQKGQPVQFVIPKATILIENPIAVTTTSTHKQQARAFVTYLRTKPAQRIFAQNGYRPVVQGVTQGLNFPVRPQLFTIKYVGGWAQVQEKFFDPRTGIMAK